MFPGDNLTGRRSQSMQDIEFSSRTVDQLPIALDGS
jgi:hypothetical protein